MTRPERKAVRAVSVIAGQVFFWPLRLKSKLGLKKREHRFDEERMLARGSTYKASIRLNLSAAQKLQHIQVRHGSTRHKIMSADDAVHLVKCGDTVTVGGFVTQNCAEDILSALGRRYQVTKKPSGLTVVFGGGPGDWKDRGMNHFAHPGMVKRAIGGHYGQAPMLGELAQKNKIEAYNLPLGSISRMIRAAAGKLPGHITTVGYGTMADPKLGGGKINTVTKEDLVEEIEVYFEVHFLYFENSNR
jgi:acyl CoA:acetate/3-ketoacid CoA transferase alpha subunit